MENKEHISALLERYFAGNASPEDIDTLYTYMLADPIDPAIDVLFEAHFMSREEATNDLRLKAARIVDNTWLTIQERLDSAIASTPRIRKFPIWSRYAAAIVVCIGIGSALYWASRDQKLSDNMVDINLQVQDIMPGSNQALLTLSNGETLALDGTNSQVVQHTDQITYGDGTEIRHLAHNETVTLTTPNGGTYSAVLQDGTKIWLNAGSAITYPSTFNKDYREVKIEGEVYFEVAKEKNRPFIVHTREQQIEVLGTTFNVNDYKNEENSKTTLLTGSVRVRTIDPSGATIVLSPGEQIVYGADKKMQVHPVDTEAIVSWKNGYFNFHAISIEESLKQIERWYDIKVIYKGKKLNGYLGGKMSRGVKLSTFVHFIEQEFNLKSEFQTNRTLLLYDDLNPKK
ncbi:FecR family protein [Sphingobacterium sp. SYP-B4668]|uniref:FecR family protein n=1 Tax=Sphingobacterium sp. SYP-B4668 TaxID=2996035 RepID=UPI0022DDED43|nr:FecR family protein [Sphingobacterium sp. SYP-B4668]